MVGKKKRSESSWLLWERWIALSYFTWQERNKITAQNENFWGEIAIFISLDHCFPCTPTTSLNLLYGSRNHPLANILTDQMKILLSSHKPNTPRWDPNISSFVSTRTFPTQTMFYVDIELVQQPTTNLPHTLQLTLFHSSFASPIVSVHFLLCEGPNRMLAFNIPKLAFFRFPFPANLHIPLHNGVHWDQYIHSTFKYVLLPKLILFSFAKMILYKFIRC
jgi:hypothetical protein